MKTLTWDDYIAWRYTFQSSNIAENKYSMIIYLVNHCPLCFECFTTLPCVRAPESEMISTWNCSFTLETAISFSVVARDLSMWGSHCSTVTKAPNDLANLAMFDHWYWCFGLSADNVQHCLAVVKPSTCPGRNAVHNLRHPTWSNTTTGV